MDSTKSSKDAFAKEIESLTAIRASVEVGANGFESSTEDYSISAAFEGRHGVFPNEIVFATKNDARLTGTGFTDQVSALRISYDRNLGNYVQDEAFTFLERFSARPIGLDARYELGGGLKTEYFLQFIPKHDEKSDYETALGSEKTTGETRHYVVLTSFGNKVRKYLAHNRELAKGATVEQLTHALEERHALFKIGASISGFLELQHTTLTVPVYSDSTRTNRLASPISVSLKGRQVARLSIRPAVTLRPGSRFRLRGEYFWKPALSGGAKKPREDAAVKLEWTPISGEKPGFKVSCEWNSYYDHDPERIDRSTVLQLERSRQFVPLNVTAERRYTTFRITMSTEFVL